jgi:glycosyltransferase involved in cell wall biosynthesis
LVKAAALAPKLSIVIPVFNEAAILESAVRELCHELDSRRLDYELILSENGSTDGSPALLESLKGQYGRLRWIHSERPNYGAALKKGILEARGQLVICDEIDLCDVTFYDQALPLLSAGGADMVIGSKAAKGASDQRPVIRRLATRVHNKLLRFTLGFRGTDTHGMKAFLRERVLPVVEACRVDMDVFASEMVIRSWRAGLKVVEIPVQLREKRRPSVHLFRRVPNVLKNVGKLIWIIRIRGR